MKKFILIVVFVIVAVIAGGIIFITSGLKQVESLEINPVDLSEVEDGTYVGKFKGYRFSNELEIVVENHEIKSIKVLKDMTISKQEVTDEVFKRVIEKQNVDIVAITGSTVTTKGYLKAIENGLNK